MKKQLKCSDLGMECDFVAVGTEEEVLVAMKEHGMATHADKMSGMSEEDMTKMMMEKMTDAPEEMAPAM